DPVTASVPGPAVAVNDVLPVLCHVTAPAVDDSTPKHEASAANATAKRASLLMAPAPGSRSPVEDGADQARPSEGQRLVGDVSLGRRRGADERRAGGAAGVSDRQRAGRSRSDAAGRRADRVHVVTGKGADDSAERRSLDR